MDLSAVTWRPGIGDPTVGGWVTVVLYFFVCFSAWRVVCLPLGSSASDIDARERFLWIFLTIMLALLGINKQLDLQSLMTDLGRITARNYGWYQDRREVQMGFIVGILICAAVFTGSLLYYLRKVLQRHRLAIIGFCFLIAFILIRATSFHASDVLIGLRLAGLKINWLLECGGLLLILVNALLLIWRWKKI